jgi:hypothetical protein
VWCIQIQWAGKWITVETGFKSRGDAEWRTAEWKQQHDCRGDPFRAIAELELSMHAEQVE